MQWPSTPPPSIPASTPAAVAAPSRRRLLIAAAALAVAPLLAQVGFAQDATTRPRTSPPPMPTTQPAETKLKLLFLGGTGFIGPQQIQYARARGHEITIANRGRTRPELFDGMEIEHIEFDREAEPAALTKAVEDGRSWDVVIDNSGYVPAHVKASAELLKDAVKQYVFISTVSVYEPQTEKGADEDWPKVEVSDEEAEKVTTIRQVGALYGPLKWRCEQAAAEVMPGRVTVIRPGLIVGPGDPTDRFTYWPVRATLEERCGGRMLVPGTREEPAPVQYVDVRDLAQFTITTAENRTTGAFNAVGNTQSLTEVVEAARAHSGSDVEFVLAPFDALQEHKVGFWQELPMVVPPDGPMKGFAYTSRARAAAAGLPETPVAETVVATLDWWQTLPQSRRDRLEGDQGPTLKPEKEMEVIEGMTSGQ